MLIDRREVHKKVYEAALCVCGGTKASERVV